MFSRLSRLTLCNPMNCSPTGSSVHGILQARILEWVVISFSRGSSQPRDQTCVCRVSCVSGLQADSLPTEPPGKSRIYKETLIIQQLKTNRQIFNSTKDLNRHFSRKRHKWPKSYGKMLSIISHQGNANQNYSERKKKTTVRCQFLPLGWLSSKSQIEASRSLKRPVAAEDSSITVSSNTDVSLFSYDEDQGSKLIQKAREAPFVPLDDGFCSNCYIWII